MLSSVFFGIEFERVKKGKIVHSVRVAQVVKERRRESKCVQTKNFDMSFSCIKREGSTLLKFTGEGYLEPSTRLSVLHPQHSILEEIVESRKSSHRESLSGKKSLLAGVAVVRASADESGIFE